MKRIFTILFIAIIANFAFAQGVKTTYFQKGNEIIVSFELNQWSLQTVTHNGVEYQKIVFESSTVTEDKGYAELPFVSATLQIPNDKNVDLIEKVRTTSTDYHLGKPLLPSRGVIYRNQDPAKIPYEIAPQSIKDEFYPANIAVLEEPFIIRDVRGVSVRFYPFQYNAATQTLQVHTYFKISLKENDETPTNPLLGEAQKPLREMEGLYRSIFLNYTPGRVALAAGEYGDILVLTTARDTAAIKPYIQWKKEKGYNVTQQVVATNTNVKSIIKNAYTANNNLFYVLLVGDWADIKSDLGTSENAPMDVRMGCVVGTDNRPDISIGRMSANSAAQVTVQVDKAIQYEKNPDLGESGWYEKFIGIASSEGSGSGDDGEIDYTHIQRIYDRRLKEPIFTYNTHLQNYEPSASLSTLVGHVNAGASTIAYCGHGDYNMFVTTGYNNTNVNASTNGVKLPFIVSVACVNGKFHGSSDCFAEAWLRKANGGAVVTWMSTINQPWTPPQRGQDYFYDILIGGYNYTGTGCNGLTTTEQRTHWGSICVNAANLMLAENSSTSDQETVDTWTTFGDPSLQLRTKRPAAIASSNNIIMLGTDYETTITNNGNPVANALVCISQDGNYYHAFTNASGNVIIPNSLTPGDVLLVVTGFNTQTIYQNIQCIAPTGAYLAAKNLKFYRGTNETATIGFNDDITLNFDIINYSPNYAAENVTFEFASSHPALQIVNNIGMVSSIAGNATYHCSGLVHLISGYNIVDGQEIGIQVIARYGEDSAAINGKLTGAAPMLSTVKMLIDDSQSGNNDHFLNAGESAHVTLIVKNIGTSAMPAANVNFNASTFINISNAENALKPIPVGGLDTIELDINCNPEIELYTPYILNMEVSFTQHFQTLTFGSTVGALVETFETGDFISVLWDNPTAEWQITDTVSNLPGNFCAESKPNVDNGIRTLKTVELDCEGGDEISFWYRTSSETADKLKFYIDGGAAKGSWGGYNNANAVWNQVAFQVTAGKHVFKWTYEKDASISRGADAVWIDDIAFPKVNNINISEPTGITEIADELVFDLFQNGNILNFQFNAKENGKAIVMIFNTLGQNVAAIQTRVDAGQNTVTFDTNNLPKGMYVCTLFANGEANSRKFVK